MEIELERTYLLKYLPESLEKCKFAKMLDIYIPTNAEHPTLRIRKKGDKFEITKKHPIEDKDSSLQSEETIPLTEEEFLDLSRISGKRVEKNRYYYDYKGRVAEIDVFQGDLKGLVLADFEFAALEEKESFIMPEFCLAEVTQEKFSAGGILAGEKYSDIESYLDKYNYRKF